MNLAPISNRIPEKITSSPDEPTKTEAAVGISDTKNNAPRPNNHSRWSITHLLGASLTDCFGRGYEPDLEAHAVDGSVYQTSFSCNNSQPCFDPISFANIIPVTGFHSDFQMVAEWKHPDFRMIEVGFFTFANPDEPGKPAITIPITLVSYKNGDQMVGIDPHSLPAFILLSLYEWFPVRFYSAVLDVERSVDSETGNWRYHRKGSGEGGVISLPDGEFYQFELEGKKKPGFSRLIPPYDGYSERSAHQGSRVGNTMGHSIGNFGAPAIFADRFVLAREATVKKIDKGAYLQKGETIRVEKVPLLKPLGIRIAGEMGQTVMAFTSVKSRWKFFDHDPRTGFPVLQKTGYPVLVEESVRVIDGSDYLVNRVWQADLSRGEEGKIIYAFANAMGRQEALFDIIRNPDTSLPIAFEQRGIAIKLWIHEKGGARLSEYGRVELQSSLPDHRLKGDKESTFSTRYRMTIYGYPIQVGEITRQADSEGRREIQIHPVRPHHAAHRPFYSRMLVTPDNEEIPIRQSACTRPTRYERFEKYPPLPAIDPCFSF